MTNESVLKFMNKVGNCSYLMLSIVYICRMDDYEPYNIYGYVKARAGRSQIIAAVINNINNS